MGTFWSKNKFRKKSLTVPKNSKEDIFRLAKTVMLFWKSTKLRGDLLLQNQLLKKVSQCRKTQRGITFSHFQKLLFNLQTVNQKWEPSGPKTNFEKKSHSAEKLKGWIFPDLHKLLCSPKTVKKLWGTFWCENKFMKKSLTVPKTLKGWISPDL